MSDIYKVAYLQIIDVLDKDYTHSMESFKSEPFLVSIHTSELQIIKNMVEKFEDAEEND